MDALTMIEGLEGWFAAHVVQGRANFSTDPVGIAAGAGGRDPSEPCGQQTARMTIAEVGGLHTSLTNEPAPTIVEAGFMLSVMEGSG